MEIGDNMFYREHYSFYKVKIVDFNENNDQVLVEEDGDWLVFSRRELNTLEQMQEKMENMY